MARLNIDITDEEHQRIKALAAMQGKSIKGYVMEKLLSPPMTDDEQQAWDELKAVITERVNAANKGAVSSKTFEEVTEETLRSLGRE
ncbi:antitoxin [Candidatus Entotheonella palauensis]|uniref:Antitoxin n=1 Tax=Candidatus Entotheonella gemina TaxID=1429439 RepID=W4MC16_9BACT|nr:antitoxin [Candidatus Entotheonella palauensis]ETX07735.1 MAG: hypothetical protein ETSY2_09475 [Candidatus Entotheonella gemina]